MLGDHVLRMPFSAQQFTDAGQLSSVTLGTSILLVV